MFDYTNSLFIERPFYGKVNDILENLIGKNGEYGLMMDFEDSSVYVYLETGIGDLTANPKYRKSRIEICEDSKMTYEKNLKDTLVQEFMKRDILNNIQSDFQSFLQEINELKSQKGDVKTFLKTALDEIDYFHNEFAKCPWLQSHTYILNELESIEDKIHSKFEIQSNVRNLESKPKPLKWHGSLPKLCSIFFYLMDKNKVDQNYFIQGSIEEIKEFIFLNFANEDGTFFDKEYITKIFNPNENRIGKELKRVVKNILKNPSDELPLEE
jgi:hypothetical protein